MTQPPDLERMLMATKANQCTEIVAEKSVLGFCTGASASLFYPTKGLPKQLSPGDGQTAVDRNQNYIYQFYNLSNLY